MELFKILKQKENYMPRLQKEFFPFVKVKPYLIHSTVKSVFKYFFFFFLTLYWGKNAIMIEFTRRHIIREIKVINYSYKNN